MAVPLRVRPIGPAVTDWRSGENHKEINRRGAPSAEIDSPRGTAKYANHAKKDGPGKPGINTKIAKNAKTDPDEESREVIRGRVGGENSLCCGWDLEVPLG